MNFCPILPALVSLVLHFSQDEAECFYSVSRLICYNDPNKRYIDQTFLTYRASCMTFGDLANRCCRGIRKLIASSHQNLFEFYSDWIMWIFAYLPFTYAIRVLDVYLLEGYKVLYRFVQHVNLIPPVYVIDSDVEFLTEFKGGTGFARPVQSVSVVSSGRRGGFPDRHETFCAEHSSPLLGRDASGESVQNPDSNTKRAQPPVQRQQGLSHAKRCQHPPEEVG